MVIMEFKNKLGEIERVGLYEKDTLKWIKWLSKKKYKQYALVNNIEIIGSVSI